jgi:hypothetical protein
LPYFFVGMSATPSLIFGSPQFLIRLVRFAHVVQRSATARRPPIERVLKITTMASLRVLKRHEIQQHPRIEGLAVFADRPILILGAIVEILALRRLLAPGDVIDVTRAGELCPNLHPRFGMREILSTKLNFLFVDEVLAFLKKQKGFKAGIVMCRLFDIVCSFSVSCR